MGDDCGPGWKDRKEQKLDLLTMAPTKVVFPVNVSRAKVMVGVSFLGG